MLCSVIRRGQHMCAMYILSCPTDFIGRGFAIIQQWLFTKIAGSFHNIIFQSLTAILLRITKKPAFAGIFLFISQTVDWIQFGGLHRGHNPRRQPNHHSHRHRYHNRPCTEWDVIAHNKSANALGQSNAQYQPQHGSHE